MNKSVGRIRESFIASKFNFYRTIYPKKTSLYLGNEYKVLRASKEKIIYDIDFQDPHSAVNKIDKLAKEPLSWLVDEESHPNSLPLILSCRGYKPHFTASGMHCFASEYQPVKTSEKIVVRKINPFCKTSRATCKKIYNQASPHPIADGELIVKFIEQADSRYRFYLASWKGEPAGFASFFLHDGKSKKPMAYLFSSFVIPSLQRRGIGTEMARVRLEEALSMNVDTFISVVKPNCRSKKILWNAGFSHLSNLTIYIR